MGWNVWLLDTKLFHDFYFKNNLSRWEFGSRVEIFVFFVKFFFKIFKMFSQGFSFIPLSHNETVPRRELNRSFVNIINSLVPKSRERVWDLDSVEKFCCSGWELLEHRASWSSELRLSRLYSVFPAAATDFVIISSSGHLHQKKWAFYCKYGGHFVFFFG